MRPAGGLHCAALQVMACPGGCIGGGGQPKSSDPLVLLKRMGAGEMGRQAAVSKLAAQSAICACCCCRRRPMLGNCVCKLVVAALCPALPSSPPLLSLAVYSIDERSALRKSHENPSVQKLYKVGQWGGGAVAAASTIPGLRPPIPPTLHWGCVPTPPPPLPPPLQEFLGEPNGPLAHELLHTTYTDRSRTSLPAGPAWKRATAAAPEREPLRQTEQGGGGGGSH